MRNNNLDFIKSREDTDYTEACKDAYRKISSHYGFTARITDIYDLFREVNDIEEFKVLNTNYVQNGELQSYLIDRIIDWANNKKINFTDIFKKILDSGDFLNSERRIFINNFAEERIWGIFLAILDPNNTTKII